MLLLCLFGFDFMGSAKTLYEDRGQCGEEGGFSEHIAVSPFTVLFFSHSVFRFILLYLHPEYQALKCNSHFLKRK